MEREGGMSHLKPLRRNLRWERRDVITVVDYFFQILEWVIVRKLVP